jgi:hypothetical protein
MPISAKQKRKRKDGQVFNPGSARHLKKLLRDTEVFDMRLKGMGYHAIAEKLGVSTPRVHQITMALVDELNGKLAEKVNQARRVELERCTRMLGYLSKKIKLGDTKAIQTGLKISERLSRLRGLDAPIDLKHSGTGEGGAISVEIFRKMLESDGKAPVEGEEKPE